ncbi:MAG TPA: DeoR family transcriptional regulator [Azospirillaceae bacterium]|nr:DeoR family transcriptional regulator [Azospirillaceae bacterium]
MADPLALNQAADRNDQRDEPAPEPPRPGAAAAQRHDQILALVRERGFVTIDTLVRHFRVTPQTLRRDLNFLGTQGRLARYHGGAGLAGSVRNLDYGARQVMNLAEKERIARMVAAQVPDDASLFINIGTTTEAVARELVHRRGLRVITNNLNVAGMLARQTTFEVIVVGGIVRPGDGGIVGESAIDMIEQFRVDLGIIGISGIDADGTLLDFDYREVRAARAIMRNARRVWLVADHSKFGRKPMVRLGSVAEVSDFFTDRPPPDGFVRLLQAKGVRLHIADGPAGG